MATEFVRGALGAPMEGAGQGLTYTEVLRESVTTIPGAEQTSRIPSSGSSKFMTTGPVMAQPGGSPALQRASYEQPAAVASYPSSGSVPSAGYPSTGVAAPMASPIASPMASPAMAQPYETVDAVPQPLVAPVLGAPVMSPAVMSPASVTIPSGEGLEQLMNFGGLRIVQNISPEELMAGVEKKNSFSVFGMNWLRHREPELAQQIFTVQEQYNLGASAYSGSKHKFSYILYNTRGLPLLRIVRKWKGLSSFVKVYDSAGRFIGELKKTRTMTLKKKLVLYNADRREVMWVHLSGFKADWRKLRVFRTDRVNGGAMKSTEDVKVGGIWKRRGVLGKKQAIDADEFDILFPDFSDLNARCLLLAASVYIDLLWFEKGQRRDRRGYA